MTSRINSVVVVERGSASEVKGGRGERGRDGGYCPGIVGAEAEFASMMTLSFLCACGCGLKVELEEVRAERGSSSLRLRLVTEANRCDLLSPFSGLSVFSVFSPFSPMGAGGGMGGKGFDETMARDVINVL